MSTGTDLGLVGGGVLLGALGALLVADIASSLCQHRWRQRFDPSLTTYLGVPIPWALRRLKQWTERQKLKDNLP